MRDLDFGDRNTVVVGANGCGKTSLATQLQQIVHKNLGIVIPAQRVLLIPNIKNIPSKTTADAIYETFDRSIPNYKKILVLITQLGIILTKKPLVANLLFS